MAYGDFTVSTVKKQFDLTIHETDDLFGDISEVVPTDAFLAVLSDNVPLALAISTEKARSELIIAPVLVEVWRLTGKQIGLFSGVDFTIDPAAGLAGVCDFILTRSPEQLFVSAPVLMLVEAKNEDMKRGFAQCLAEMVAAQQFNARDELSGPIYGAVTTGNNWRFLQLHGSEAGIDHREYYIDQVGKIMGVLLHLTR